MGPWIVYEVSEVPSRLHMEKRETEASARTVGYPDMHCEPNTQPRNLP